MEFIIDLLPSKEPKYNFVLDIICWLTKVAYFTQYHKKITAIKLIKLLQKAIICLHRLFGFIILWFHQIAAQNLFFRFSQPYIIILR